MSWTDAVEYVAQDPAPAALLNTLKANLEYLHLPNFAEYQHPGTGGDYTTTADRGADIDGTNFALTITTYGNPSLVVAAFHGSGGSSVTTSSLRINMVNADDVNSYAGRNLFYDYALETSAVRVGLGWMQWFVVPPGTHTFKAIWGIYGGGTGTLYVASRPWMAVMEL